MDEVRILSLLNQFNRWWDGEDVPKTIKTADHRRRDYFVVKKRLVPDGDILAIRGPRQVGKTTLCGQLIEHLLERSVDPVPPERVLYLTADNSQILSNPDNVIRDSIEVFEQYVLEQSLDAVAGPIYIFIDEIQKITDWAAVLKYYVDAYTSIQFVVTGSVSTLIKQDASETLVGRLSEQILLPMKYVDRVRYEEILDEDTIYQHSTTIRGALKRSVRSGEPEEFTTELTDFYGRNTDAVPALNRLKNDHLLMGGYPGVLDQDPVSAYAKLDADLRNTVTGDLANVFNVTKPNKLLRVLSLVMESTGGKVNVQRIADTADIGRDTVERYVDYLEEFFLVGWCEPHATSEYRRRGRPKLYLQDVGLYNTLAGTMSETTLTNAERMGPILETAVFDHCRRLQFNLSNHQTVDVAFWDGGGEVDFVLDHPEYLLPIEVKHGDSTERDLRGMKRFLDESSASFGIAVNDGGAFEVEDDIVHVPCWLFLFFC